MNLLKRAAAVAVMVTMAGCITEPQPLLDQFSWEAEPNQANITEGVTIASLFGDISFLGQAKTPSLCYSASSKLAPDGFTLTVNINITPTGASNCSQQPAGVRYTGVVKNLSSGTYTVHIIQNVSGVGIREFTQDVKL